MKTTGVIRRIDDLGRIVIPKEIRKTMRIKDGESLEIFLDSDNIILKKYSLLDNLTDFYKKYVDSISSAIDKNVIIVDRDKIVASAGVNKKKYLDKNISSYIDEIIQKRTLVAKKNMDNISIINEDNEKLSYVVAPIIINSDAIGAVIIFSNDTIIDEFEKKTADIAAKFLGKYIEE